MDDQRRLKQDVYYFLNTKRFNHIANIERDTWIFHNNKNEQTESKQHDIETEEDFDYPLITYPETVTECLPISEDKSDMAVYVLKKGTQIPEGFTVTFDKYYHIEIYPTEKVKGKYYSNECFTYNDITNLNWELYGYVEIKKVADCAEWFIDKHKEDWHQGKGFKINFMQYIENVIQVSKDTVNRIDAMFFPFLTKMPDVNKKEVYSYLNNIIWDYMGHSDYFDACADWEINSMITYIKTQIS